MVPPPFVVQNLLDEEVGGLLDVGPVFGRCREPAREALLPAELVGLGRLYGDGVALKIALVADQNAGDRAAVWEQNFAI